MFTSERTYSVVQSGKTEGQIFTKSAGDGQREKSESGELCLAVCRRHRDVMGRYEKATKYWKDNIYTNSISIIILNIITRASLTLICHAASQLT